MKRWYFFFLLAFSFITQCIVEGVAPYSLVKTDYSYEYADNLKSADFLISYNKQKIVTRNYISRIKRERVQSTVVIEVEGACFQIAPDTKVYFPNEDRWVRAYKIKEEDVLFSLKYGPVAVRHVHKEHGLQEIISFTIEPDHNLFISEAEILIHNGVGEAIAAGGHYAGTLVAAESVPAICTLAGPAITTAAILYLAGCGLYQIYDYFSYPPENPPVPPILVPRPDQQYGEMNVEEYLLRNGHLPPHYLQNSIPQSPIPQGPLLPPSGGGPTDPQDPKKSTEKDKKPDNENQKQARPGQCCKDRHKIKINKGQVKIGIHKSKILILTQEALRHAMHGEIKKGKLTGCHTLRTCYEVIQKGASLSNGVVEAIIKYGNLVKKDVSTILPDPWTIEEFFISELQRAFAAGHILDEGENYIVLECINNIAMKVTFRGNGYITSIFPEWQLTKKLLGL